MVLEQIEERFEELVKEYAEAPAFTKEEKKKRLLSQIDVLLRKEEGISYLYGRMDRLLEAGMLTDTVWEDPRRLVPGLVSGTLLAGYPTSSLELLSELRLLAIMEKHVGHPDFSPAEAREWLQQMIVKNFDLFEDDFRAEAWLLYNKGELKKIRLMSDLLFSKVPLLSLKPLIAQELEVQTAHRPIAMRKVRSMLAAVRKHLTLHPGVSVDERLQVFYHAVYRPSPQTAREPLLSTYQKKLKKLSASKLEAECQEMGHHLSATGLVSRYQVALLQYVSRNHPELVPKLLDLGPHGRAEYDRHQELVGRIIREAITPAAPQAIYGLSRMLGRTLLSQRVTSNALQRLMGIDIHPEVEQRLRRGNMSGKEATARQLLISGVLGVLGQPLGVRQGNNPTCQSARGISMWSRHAPGKLLNFIIDAATTDNLIMRFSGELIESAQTGQGLVQQLDYKLDPVSLVLVPHLDKIYNEMMTRAMQLKPGEDPHISVNPAFYGHWIQTGFRSVFSPLYRQVVNFDEFVRVFYVSFHPEYNGGYRVIYPVPLGILITSSSGRMQGFHAISLLRVDQDENGEWRVYYFNPNSEGPQNWGQGIEPSVHGHGERRGESSLPFHQFLARVYAYHYNRLRVGEMAESVPQNLVQRVRKLAEESWGRAYVWLN